MSYENAMLPILRSQCPQVFAVTAPFGTRTPYVIWQRAGGKVLRNIDKTPTGQLRNASVNVHAWADTPQQASNLLRKIEDALTASTAITALPVDEPLDVFDDAGETANIFGFQQTFNIWAPR